MRPALSINGRVLVTTLDHISPIGLTWAQLANPTPPPAREHIATTDGGYVELWYDGGFHLQKHNAAGTPVGAEYTNSGTAHVVALSDGGYAVAFDATRGPSLIQFMATVFDAAGAVERGSFLVSDVASAQEIDIAASPLGGFFITTRWDPAGSSPIHEVSFLNMYDNSGVRTLTARVSNTLPDVSVLPDGTYRVTWTDDGTARGLTIDPRNPPDLSAPAAPDIFMVDDVAPQTGTIHVEPTTFTNDTNLTLRFTVTEPGEFDLQFQFAAGPSAVITNPSAPQTRSIAITAADVSRGYVEVTIPLPSGENWLIGAARITDVNGVIQQGSLTGPDSAVYQLS